MFNLIALFFLLWGCIPSEDNNEVTSINSLKAGTEEVALVADGSQTNNSLFQENLDWQLKDCEEPTNTTIHVGANYQYKTLLDAKNAVREITKNAFATPEGGVTVLIHGGRYNFTSTLIFDYHDSGNKDKIVTWKAACGEDVRFTGDVTIQPSWMKPVDSNTPNYNRISSEHRSKIYYVDLAANGVSELYPLQRRGYQTKPPNLAGIPGPSELIYNGQIKHHARWPNPDDNSTRQDSMYLQGSFGDVDISGTYIPIGTEVKAGVAALDDGYMNYKRDGLVKYNGEDVQFYMYHCDFSTIPGNKTNRTTWWVAPYNPLDGPVTCTPYKTEPNYGTYPRFHASDDGRLRPDGDWSSNYIGIFRPYEGDEVIEEGFLRYFEVDASKYSFKFPGNRFNQWENYSNVWLHGRFYYPWADDTIPAEIDNYGNVTLNMAPSMGMFHNYGYVYFINVLEELDQPNEYYMDYENKILYFYPPENSYGVAGSQISLTNLGVPFLKFEKNVSYVVFEGMVFENSRAAFVRMKDALNVTFNKVLMRNGGAMAIYADASNNDTFDHLKIYNMGSGGIYFKGGDRPTLAKSKTVIKNSEFFNLGRWDRMYRPAVEIAGCGITVQNNYMHDLPHSAIMFTGNEHDISYNYIKNVVTEANDSGAIYTPGRNMSYRGTVVNNNIIDTAGESAFNEKWDVPVNGIYFDGGASGHYAQNNILYNIHGHAFAAGGSRDIAIRGNIVSGADDCFRTNRVLRALVTNTTLNTPSNSGWWEGLSYNLLYWLKEVNYKGELWRNKYPRLAMIPDSYYYTQIKDGIEYKYYTITLTNQKWLDPEGTIFINNICHNTRMVLSEGTSGGTGGLNFIGAGENQTIDPLFISPETGNFSFSSGSPVPGLPWAGTTDPSKVGIQE